MQIGGDRDCGVKPEILLRRIDFGSIVIPGQTFRKADRKPGFSDSRASPAHAARYCVGSLAARWWSPFIPLSRNPMGTVPRRLVLGCSESTIGDNDRRRLMIDTCLCQEASPAKAASFPPDSSQGASSCRMFESLS